MFTYTPRLHDAIITAVLCVICLALGGKTAGRVASAFNFGALLFGFLFFLVVVLMFLEGLNRRVEVMTDFANAISKLDDEARAMMAFEFPSLRYRMKRGEVREYFEDTSVTIEMFKEFLRSSDSKHISPRRYWFRAERPEWAWLEIKGWLEDHELVVPDSAAGSHSWMWKGNAYDHLKAYWGVGLKLRDMSDEMVMHSPGYAPPPQAEEVGSD
jgi:hypothetical protein